MLTLHQRARLHRQEFLDTAPVIYPAEAATELGADDDLACASAGLITPPGPMRSRRVEDHGGPGT